MSLQMTLGNHENSTIMQILFLFLADVRKLRSQEVTKTLAIYYQSRDAILGEEFESCHTKYTCVYCTYLINKFYIKSKCIEVYEGFRNSV